MEVASGVSHEDEDNNNGDEEVAHIATRLKQATGKKSATLRCQLLRRRPRSLMMTGAADVFHDIRVHMSFGEQLVFPSAVRQHAVGGDRG